MANQEHLAILRKGVVEWKAWRNLHSEVWPDLSRANLEHAKLSRADLSRAYLIGADLRGVNLDHAKLSRANLTGADLRGAYLTNGDLEESNFSRADLSSADLERADLSGADLSWADLIWAKLSGANLSRADLSRANLTGAYLNQADLSGAMALRTVFADIDLSDVHGLESVQHKGPSSIGIDTIYRSNGHIPEIFLRQAGVPEPFIVQMKALVGAMEPIQFYSCFISYSTDDQPFAERLHADLQAEAVRTWFAPHDIKAGKKIHEQIDEAIRVYDKLLLVLSPSSMSSEWVGTEIAKARRREVREKRRMLFPIRLAPFEQLRDWELFDADTGKDSAREIREYFIPDFSNWKNHDSYQAAFDRLLRDLKAEAEAATR